MNLDKFEEASEAVKKVILRTKLMYSEYFSEVSGNKVYLKPENMQFTGAYKVRGAYYKISTYQARKEIRDLSLPRLEIMLRVLPMLQSFQCQGNNCNAKYYALN